ncbi:SDR family NAD(P)-dependent oxidoreductase [Bacteroides mediterraneensis]|uniref:SDR family NAD(P)-dependent oxidoreductase n=1 Tax=Bacteroides mediterraneensis TaxID=1841856 RepID=UPI00293741F3|nr:SDR family oxidoreductase [Bacteroides mediterraneensis]
MVKRPLRFNNRGTSGIGFCIAKAFLDSGATVIITSRNDERLKISCEKLAESYKERIFGIVLDNTKVNTFEQAFQNAISLIGGRHIDILVNNAGILGGDIRTTSVTEYDNVMNTNLRGVFFLSQLFGKYMKENGIEGNILNIASSSSLRPAVSAYMLSKWGIRGLTLGLARAFAPYGITVNGIAPGPTATPMLLKDTSRSLANDTILGRYALPEEIANMAVFLVSGLGKTILGDIIYMTGGSALVSFEGIDYSF